MIYVVTTVKNISEIHTTIQLYQPTPGQTGSNGMDSNTNTFFARKNYVILKLTTRTAEVYPYKSTSYKPLYNSPIVFAVTAYDDRTTGETFIFVLN